MEKINRVSLAVIINNLQWATEEMNEYMAKSAYSSNIKIRRDCSCALYDRKGNMLAQGAFVPVHLGVMAQALKKLLEIFPPETWKEEDAVIHNDPYLMGAHLNDVLVFKPIFWEGILVGFAGANAHQVDVGGSPTKLNVRTVFEEGLRITGFRFVREGVLQEDILRFILDNVRTPYEVRGDIMGELAACNRGEARVHTLAEKYGAKKLIDYFDGILDYSEAGMRASIRNLPNGSFEYEDIVENDGFKMANNKVKVKVTVEDEDIYVDFDGSDPPAEGSCNSVWSTSTSATYYAVKAVCGSNIPANSGAYRAIHAIPPKAPSVVNCNFPHAVNACTSIVPQRIADCIIGALSQLVPERCCACDGQWNSMRFGGEDARTGRFFSYVETYGAGRGAKHNEDGASAHQTHMTNTANAPVEIIELEHPLQVNEYCLVEGSGGAGEFRGGLGIRRAITVLTDVDFSFMTDRSQHHPYGLFGGLGGACDSMKAVDHNGKKVDLHNKVLLAGSKATLQTSGGGGWGDPKKRAQKMVEWDVLNGYISEQDAKELYGRDIIFKDIKK